jgi:predicted O-methyltransferase YrrM
MGVRIRPAIKFIKDRVKDKKLMGAEIGVYKGGHAYSLINNLKFEKLYLIDLWEPYSQRGRTVKKVASYYLKVLEKFRFNPEIEIIKGASAEIVEKFKDNSLDFVYIDGCHDKEMVALDIKVWTSKVKHNGIVAGHDYSFSWPGVKEAVDEYVKENYLDLNYKHNDWWFIKWWFIK